MKKKYKQTSKVIYFIHGNMVILQPVMKKRFHNVNISCCCALAAKIQSTFTNVISCFMAFGLESSISILTSILSRNLTLPFLKLCCFFVVLVVSNFFALNIEQFEE